MRAITPDLEAILVSKFQAGASGFRGRIEIDVPGAGVPGAIVQHFSVEAGNAGDAIVSFPAAVTPGNTLLVIQARRSGGDGGILFTPGLTGIGPTRAFTQIGPFVHVRAGDLAGADSMAFMWRTATGDEQTLDWAATQLQMECYELAGVDIASAEVLHLSAQAGSSTKSLGAFSGSAAGDVLLAGYVLDASDGGASADQAVGTGWTQDHQFWDATTTGHPSTVAMHGAVGSTPSISGASHEWGAIALRIPAATVATLDTVSIQPSRISIDKSRKMAAQQMSFEVTNELGSWSRFPSQTTFLEDMVVRAYEWYGDIANEVLVFTGLTDKLIEHRDPRKVTVTCRSMLKRGLVQTFSTIGPQGAAEAGAVRTAANGVYLNMEASDIVADIAARMGWPSDKLAISPTSFMVDEYDLPDGTSWAECIAGTDRLTAMTGYELFDDEDGVLHFEPTGLSAAPDSDTPQTPDYTFTAGVDLTALDLANDDYDVKTRVKVTGPLTTNRPAWVETWHTNVIRKPVGLFYDPADPTHLYVLDRSTAKLYKILQSTRAIVSSVAFTGISYPLGISGDPSDSSIVWILNAPWRYTGSTTGNSIKKVRRSDGVTLATYALADGRWTTIKVSASYIWLGNWDTDKVHKHSKADGSSIASYTVTYASVAQTNPTGIAIDGTTLLTFFYGMSGGNRFLLVDESDPTTVDPTNALGVTSGVVSTAGTSILGGEMDTTTHADLYACSDSLGLVWKFHLVEPVTDNVATLAADQELEDLLGERSQAEPRVHDLHPGDAAHAYEIRRMTLALKLITSLAQATEAATRQLAQVSRFTQTLDAGIIGNPAIQLRDMIAVVDPPSAIDSTMYWLLDTYRTELDASAGTFVGTVALLPWNAGY